MRFDHFMHRICVPCLVTGTSLLLLSCVAYAAESSTGASWEVIALAAVGVATTMIGAYAKGIERRVGNNEREIKQCVASNATLHNLVVGQYLDNTDVDRVLAPIHLQFSEQRVALEKQSEAITKMQVQLAGLHGRLDRYFGEPPRHPAQNTGD